MTTTRDPLFGCELVMSRLDREGYAFHGKTRAHIKAWVDANGPVPEGMEIEHRCKRRNCRAVHHLMLVTRGDNEKLKRWRHRVKEKQCPRGHDMAINAVVTPEGGRVCRQCNREASR